MTRKLFAIALGTGIMMSGLALVAPEDADGIAVGAVMAVIFMMIAVAPGWITGPTRLSRVV